VDAGAAHVFLGPFAGVIPVASADAVLDGAAAGERAGTSLARVWDQLAVGAPASDGYGLVAPAGAGSVTLVDVPLAGAWSLDDAASAVLRGTTLGDAAGFSVAAAGDADRDGREDLLVGAPLAGGGTVWIVYGP
jgi:hypothetical protein